MLCAGMLSCFLLKPSEHTNLIQKFPQLCFQCLQTNTNSLIIQKQISKVFHQLVLRDYLYHFNDNSPLILDLKETLSC